ncbi:MAG: hypothetical protein H0W25_09880 [Acidimicrobiia bacterium]|nr:hypothetical protein [Acidimicrobiia bacterium]
MAVHTCPRCELRFERENEVADHLVSDHGADPDALRSRLRHDPPAEGKSAGGNPPAG